MTEYDELAGDIEEKEGVVGPDDFKAFIGLFHTLIITAGIAVCVMFISESTTVVLRDHRLGDEVRRLRVDLDTLKNRIDQSQPQGSVPK